MSVSTLIRKGSTVLDNCMVQVPYDVVSSGGSQDVQNKQRRQLVLCWITEQRPMHVTWYFIKVGILLASVLLFSVSEICAWKNERGCCAVCAQQMFLICPFTEHLALCLAATPT